MSVSSTVTNRPRDPQDDEMWIGDSGATIHITNDDAGMFNIKRCDYDITVGNQETAQCTKMGDKPEAQKFSWNNCNSYTI